MVHCKPTWVALLSGSPTISCVLGIDCRRLQLRKEEQWELLRIVMEEGGLRGSVKEAVGSTLAGATGVLCMRTQCQDVVPKCISGKCKEVARGRQARKSCRPLLAECQQDPVGIASCVERCARYFAGDEVKVCDRDCNRVRCAVYPKYEDCVAVNTLADMLACFEKNCRFAAMDCLANRCHLDPADVSLVKASLPGTP
jgi:hypothetical protein